MKEAVVHVHRGGPLVALVGNPNCGKTALFNRLTGSHQKVANYAGVTVERKEGRLITPAGKTLRLLDLPGAYSLHPRSLDESVTVDVLRGRAQGEKRPDLVVCVVDATHLRRNLRLVLAVKRLGLPCMVALNMVDLAQRRGLAIDPAALSRELGLPVVSTVAVQVHGADALKQLLDDASVWGREPAAEAEQAASATPEADTRGDHEAVRGILQRLGLDTSVPHLMSDRIDRVVLHPVLGPLMLAVVLFFVFQAVFAWAEAPMGWIEATTGWLADTVGAWLPTEGWLRSLVIDGLVAGLGGVVIFLPQIIILFFFILAMEASGYMARAAFLMDRMMASVGLSGRSFIPLLSSFACAIPGIMATRTIMDQKERLATILIAPLMTCSARLPVYTVIIGAFIPATTVGPGIGLQGLVLFGLYISGILGAMLAASVIQRFVTQSQTSSFLIEMPRYQWPRLNDIALGLWQRAWVFLRRAGTIIFAATIILWALLSFPKAPEGSGVSQVEYSVAGRIADGLEPIVRPIGFNHDIALALIPAMAAREVAVSALATVYAIDAADEDAAASSLGPKLAADWSLATALAFLAWFVFAPQCISTIAVTRRETNGWKWPIFMVTYLFALAYAAAGITYWTARSFGL